MRYMFDLWTIWHLIGWTLMTWMLIDHSPRSWRLGILVCALVTGVAWELTEWLWVEPYLGFHEPWPNRVMDVVVDFLGVAWAALETRTR